LAKKAPATIGSVQTSAGDPLREAGAEEPALRDVMRYLEGGRLEQARALCKDIIARAPRQPFALHVLGMIEFHSGDMHKAERLVTQAATLKPDSAMFLADLAAIFRTQGRIDKAIEVCRKVLNLNSRDGDTWYRLGCFLKDSDDMDESIVAFREAIKLRPGFVAAHLNLGVALKEIGDLEAAEAAYRHAIEIDPYAASVYYNHGILLHEKGEYAAAENAFKDALRLEPRDIDAQYNLGLVIFDQGRAGEAVEAYEAVLEQAPLHADLRNNLGLAYQDLGELGRAIGCFEQAIAIDPVHGEAYFNRAIIQLLRGQLGEGWDEYDYRWETINQTLPQYQVPWWQGEDLADKHIAVFGEQGPGDVVMFAHCLVNLIACAGEVSLRVEPRLVNLFQRSFADCKVSPAIATDGSLSPVEADYVVPFGSLPRFFRRTEQSFSVVTQPYLKVDARTVDHWRQRFTELGGGPYIGISWRGGATAKERKRRVIELCDWTPILSRRGATFINLQYGDRAADIASLSSSHGITLHDWEGAVVALDDFAAQIEALDLVISVANTTVHFAGALNKDVWTLAPAQPSWRWQLGRKDSPWYPSMRILRQGWDEPWSAVLGRAAKDFDDWLASVDESPRN
jgi:tetratricopeptide (TPR) repeat protein